jgi:signal transduction histidine kinase
MYSEEEKTFSNLNQILLYLSSGEMQSAIELLNKTESDFPGKARQAEFYANFRVFIQQYQDGAFFLQAIANGNLEVNPPLDPLHQNYVITQYKQLHSNLLHLTWQTQQIAKGDLKQKVSFLGEFSIGFNKMMEALREKKLMEDKITLQNAQLQKVNAEKDKFFSIIAHDLRSPFNGFLGLTKMMADDLSGMSHADIQDIAVSMRDSATNLFRLLENLLEWSRIEQGLIPFSPEVSFLRPIVLESVSMVGGSANIKSIEITLEIPGDLSVFADSQILQTVIRNLVSNAVKFTPKGGKISLSARLTPEDKVEISIRDSGIGMDAEMLGNLFHIDARTGREGTEGESSTGLGLILCKEFVEKHGGTIWAESEAGKGSTFFFTLNNLNNG